MYRGVGPVLLEDCLGVLVVLDEPEGFESSCSFEAEFDATDSTE
jgi:hypothetical protein